VVTSTKKLDETLKTSLQDTIDAKENTISKLKEQLTELQAELKTSLGKEIGLKVGLSQSSAGYGSSKLTPFSKIDHRSALLGASPLLSMVQSPSPERDTQEIGVQGQVVSESLDVTLEYMEVGEGVDDSLLEENVNHSYDLEDSDHEVDLEDHSDEVDPDYKPLTLTMEDLAQVIVYTKENCLEQMNWLLNALTPVGQKEIVNDIVANYTRNLHDDNGTFIWDMFLREIQVTLQVPDKPDDTAS
jgi:hypothetical protein